ncbi:hypothetical protein BDV93DRAFT_524569 [Ceratobasidium sp. AG-I]|nr:hypothetical protein BDV93DRAFT_524569 [Ceratobasidium sp. AG-I]
MPARSQLDNVTATNDAINDSMSEVMSVAMTDDRESTVGTVAPSVPNPEVEHVREVLATMKQTLASLGMNFDALGDQTAKVATLPSGMETNQEILAVQRHMSRQRRKQDENIEEIKKLLREVAQEQIVEHLRKTVADQVMEIIDEFVEEEVQRNLDEIIPLELQRQVDDQKRQLEDVRRNLHNSEARRANALLRSTHMTDPLHKLLMQNGMVSADFPEHLGELFAMDGTQAKRLLAEYDIEASESREKNLNRFMQFVGVSYQMVPSQASSVGGSTVNGY